MNLDLHCHTYFNLWHNKCIESTASHLSLTKIFPIFQLDNLLQHFFRMLTSLFVCLQRVIHIYTLCSSCCLCGPFFRDFDKFLWHSIVWTSTSIFLFNWIFQITSLLFNIAQLGSLSSNILNVTNITDQSVNTGWYVSNQIRSVAPQQKICFLVTTLEANMLGRVKRQFQFWKIKI